MIGLPFNDLHCLGSITEVVAELVENRDPVIAELAAKHRTTTSLAAWIRSLPQRDDDGDKCDGPKVETCEPPQRLRLPAEDPNCVERAALYVAVSELIDHQPVRQLATLDTPMGLHTFPVENGAPIILDPRISKDCLECGVALDGEGPVAIEPIDAIEWTAKLAEVDSKQTRNGPSKVRRARNAVMRLADGGHVPTQAEVDAIGWMFALAEQAARRMGSRAVAMVRTTAQAIADLADEMIATQPRNLSIDFEGAHFDVPRWVSQFGKAAANVGMDVGAGALRSQLSELGIGDDMMGLVEQELNREGLTMGALARPPKLPTFANMNAKRAA